MENIAPSTSSWPPDPCLPRLSRTLPLQLWLERVIAESEVELPGVQQAIQMEANGEGFTLSAHIAGYWRRLQLRRR